MKAQADTHNRTQRLNYVLAVIVGLSAIQMWMMTLSLRAYMAGDPTYLWVTAIISMLLCAVNILLWFFLVH